MNRLRHLRGMMLFALLALAHPLAGQDLAGHGGPVRAIIALPDGAQAVTAGFDSSLIRWNLQRGQASAVLRFHEGSVNALVLLGDGRIASAGEDGRIALWGAEGREPVAVLEGHKGPVSALAVSPDGSRLGSASWDGTARLWPLRGGAAEVLADHKANVNGIGFLPDGSAVSAAYDGVLRIFRTPIIQRTLDAPLSAMVIAGDEIILAGADGALRIVDGAGEEKAKIAVADAPLASLAVSSDGRTIATAGFRGTLAIIDRASRDIIRKLEGPAFPVWSLAFSANGQELFTGGANRVVRRWSVATGEPLSPVEPGVQDGIPARLRGHPGAEVFKACSACHALVPQPEGGALAGPSLAGVFGRKIATLPGYDFSPALKALTIVWTEETIQRLFEIGPMAYTPGTKMPEQKIIRPEDRKALTDFLKAAQP